MLMLFTYRYDDTANTESSESYQELVKYSVTIYYIFIQTKYYLLF